MDYQKTRVPTFFHTTKESDTSERWRKPPTLNVFLISSKRVYARAAYVAGENEKDKNYTHLYYAQFKELYPDDSQAWALSSLH